MSMTRLPDFYEGLVPGVYDRRDDKYVRVTGNEVVLKPDDWMPIRQYLRKKNVKGFADSGGVWESEDNRTASGFSNSGDGGDLTIDNVNVYIDAEGIATAVVETRQFKKATVKNVRVAAKDRKL
jgi:hypothetical protein